MRFLFAVFGIHSWNRFLVTKPTAVANAIVLLTSTAMVDVNETKQKRQTNDEEKKQQPTEAKLPKNGCSLCEIYLDVWHYVELWSKTGFPSSQITQLFFHKIWIKKQTHYNRFIFVWSNSFINLKRVNVMAPLGDCADQPIVHFMRQIWHSISVCFFFASFLFQYWCDKKCDKIYVRSIVNELAVE